MKEKSLEWLKFAKDDFEVGQSILITFKERYVGIVAYHFQQSAEKALKSFLIFKGQLVPRSHNLNVLLEQCELLDIDFKTIRTQADALNPFSTKTRYPDDISSHLTYEEAQELLTYSKKILQLIEKKHLTSKYLKK
jgi:HEPN domain-containing protein